MRRSSPLQSIASSPTMVGAITTLILVVAVFLAYNANSGLPFVPVYRVSVVVPSGARITRDNEIRIGGTRVGVVESVEAVRTTPGGSLAQTTSSDSSGNGSSSTCCVAAQLNLKLDKTASPIPEDSIFRVRYKSTFGLKYVEVVRGVGKDAPEGYTFDGLDDHGECPLPTDPQAFASSEPKTSKNGCFQTQTEFDVISNTFDQPTRNASRRNLVGFGDAFAARGASLNEAIDRLAPLFKDLKPVATNLADPSTGLERFIKALSKTAQIVAPVAAQQSQMFTNAAVAFDAISSDPLALQATISSAVPVLEQGPAELARQRPFLARFAELSRRLRPGVQQLRVALPVLDSAIKVGTPTLLRTPPISAKLRSVFVSLRRLVQQPSTKISLQRLKETFDQAKPLVRWVAPAQTVCNYWNYFFTYIPNGLSDRDQVGFSFRQSGIGFPLGDSKVALLPPPVPPVTIPGQVKAPLGGYSGKQANGVTSTLSPSPNEFAPFDHTGPLGRGADAPILEAHPYAPTGQPFTADAAGGRTPDCQPGQTGYYYGADPLPGQPASNPAEGAGDIPGSRGPTTLFTKQDNKRVLKDTRIPSHQP